MAKRKLSDLYVVGKELTFDDGQGDAVVVWLNKISTVDSERAIRMANAKRSSILALQKKTDSDEYAGLLADVYDRDKAGLVSELVEEQASKKAAAVTAELEADEKWAKDGYIDGLRDQWIEGGLGRKYAENSEDSEATAVLEELQKFADEIDRRLELERKELTKVFEKKSEDELRDLWRKSRLEGEADNAWLREYRKAEIFFAVREVDNHRKYYFGNREEVDELPQEIYLQLLVEYRSLTVDILEGKDLQPDQDSSTPSEQPEQADQESSSGPPAATA